MSLGTPNPQAEYNQLEQSFRELREWVDARMIAKGLQRYFLPQTRGEAPAITQSDIDKLKADIATLIQLEGRRSFWGLWVGLLSISLSLASSGRFETLAGR